MKNAINYYYDLHFNEIVKKRDNYKLIDDNYTYYLILFNGNWFKLSSIYEYLVKNNIYCHEIISNKSQEYVTVIDNNNYVLIKLNYHIRPINFMEVLNFNVYMKQDGKCNWHYLWCKKIDYYEYQMSQFKKKYKVLYESFGYYSNLAEVAISLAGVIKNKTFNFYLNHSRISKNYSTIEFYNPINIITDVKIRDVCEYFKNQFFYSTLSYESIIFYLKNNTLTNEEAILFLARLIYPSYYFDLYDEIIQNYKSEQQIFVVLKRTDEFEYLIKNIYYELNKMYQLPEIEWLIKT